MKGEKKTLKIKMNVGLNLVELYESIRSHSLSAGFSYAAPLGMTLFLEKGTAAWIYAMLSDLDLPEMNKYRKNLPEDYNSELVMLLAGIMLNWRYDDEPAKNITITSST